MILICRPARHNPLGWLAGDFGDAVVIGVVVQNDQRESVYHAVQAVRGLVRNPLMPPSTASAVPVVAPASGLAR